MGVYRKVNGILYCNSGTIKTNDFNIVDQCLKCLKRITHVGDLKKDDIVIEYSQGGSYTFYIKESVYTICYSSVISTFKEENK